MKPPEATASGGVFSIKEILQYIEEFFALGVGLAIQTLVQLPQQILLLLAELGWRFYHHGELLIAPAAVTDRGGDTLLLDGKGGAGLSALGNGVIYLTIQGRHLNFRTQSRLGEGDGYLTVDRGAISLEDGMALDIHFHQQIAVAATVGANAALTGNRETLAVVDACRHMNRLLMDTVDLALAFTGGAGGLDDLTTATATGTGGGGLHLHTHEILNRFHLTGATALGAGFNLAIGAAAAVTGAAVFNSPGGNFLFTAKSCFFKGNFDANCHIFTPTGGIPPLAAAAATEEGTENITQITEISETAIAATAIATLTGAVIGIHAGEAELIITGALLVIGKDFVSLADLLELLLGSLVAGVAVRMVFHGAFSVCFFNFLSAGALLDTQHLVVVTFILCQNIHPW